MLERFHEFFIGYEACMRFVDILEDFSIFRRFDFSSQYVERDSLQWESVSIKAKTCYQLDW